MPLVFRWLLVFDPEWLGQDDVFEDLKKVRLRLVSKEGLKRVVAMDHDAIVITVHQHWRDCVVVQGNC